MIGLASAALAPRSAAQARGCVATVGKTRIIPGGVNAIPSAATAWLDARRADEDAVRDTVDDVAEATEAFAATLRQESWTPTTRIDADLISRLRAGPPDTPLPPTSTRSPGHPRQVATLLPGVEFSTRSPYPDARRLLGAGVSIALATDCNPGTCNSSSMPFMIALAVQGMGLTPAEALYAATAGAARSLRRADLGRIAIGSRADLAVIDAPSHLHLAYRPGVPIVRAVQIPPP